MDDLETEIDIKVKKKLESDVVRRLKPKPVKVVAQFELNCFAKLGIDAIKEALRCGEMTSEDGIQIDVSLIAPPLYILSSTTSKKKACFNLMKQALEAIKEKILSLKGTFKLKEKPFVVGKKHEKELKDRLMELNQEEENEFVYED